ncbi:MAG: amidohydrolase family protein [Clostridia bacterium]|nr:amidohydrolase family protein [Clostridia bacterium]
MKVFDCHVHSSMPQSVEKSVKVFEQIFDMLSVEKCSFMSIPQHDKENIDYKQNIKDLFFKNYFSPNGYAFAGLEYKRELDDKERANDHLKQAEEYIGAGFDGMKMLEGKPSVRREFNRRLADPVFDKFFAFMEENGLPVTLHNADPYEFWDISKMTPEAIARGWANGPDDLTKEEMTEDVFEVLKKHPKLHLTLAHFGFFGNDHAAAVRFFGDYEYTRLDTTPAGEEYFHMLADWDKWRKFIEEHADRIKYGTDTYNFIQTTSLEAWERSVSARPNLVRNFFATDGEHEYYGEKYKGVKFSEEIVEKIFWKNAEKEYGTPKKIDGAWVEKKLAALEQRYANDQAALQDVLFMKENFKL